MVKERIRIVGAFPTTHFCNKLVDKLNQKVASVSLRQTNLVCYKLLTDEYVKNVRHLYSGRIYALVCCKNVSLET
jgi:hypothetical protein